MSDNSYTAGSTRAGTIGGTLLVLLLRVESAELLETAVLAATGAAVSFAVSKGLQWLIREIKRKPIKKDDEVLEEKL